MLMDTLEDMLEESKGNQSGFGRIAASSPPPEGGRHIYRIFFPNADSASSVPNSAVVFRRVERRVDLDQVERRQLARLGDHLHHDVRLAVV